MTGIDRLRAIAGAWDEWGLGGTLAEMADQIERELQEERDRWDSELCEAQMDKSRVTAVYLEMNKHCLGHEGMEDSPVARWARELRGALKSDASDGSEAQNPSCADPDGAADVTSEAPKVTRDPAGDVSMSAYDLLPADERDAIAWVRDHGGLSDVRLCHNAADNRRAELCSALGIDLETGWNDAMAVMRPRLMPEGMEWLVEAWPRFDDDAPVRGGDEVCGGGRAFIVDHVVLFSNGESTVCAEADMDSGKVRDYVRVRPSYRLKRPESWERLEEDAEKDPCNYFGFDGEETCGKCPASGKNCEQTMARDIVRRARALAERSE